MSEIEPIVYTRQEREKVLYASSDEAISNARVIWWTQHHKDKSKNDQMKSFFNRNLKGGVLLVEGYDYGEPVEGFFDPNVEAIGWEVNPEIILLNHARNRASKRAAEGVMQHAATMYEHSERYASFLESCALRTVYSIVPAMEAIWDEEPDTRIGVVAGMGHVITDPSMTRFLDPREQEIVTYHGLVSQIESPLAETMISHGGFVILGDRFDFGSLQPPPRRTAQPRRPRSRWL